MNQENFQVLSKSEVAVVNCPLGRGRPAGIQQDEQWQSAVLRELAATAAALGLRTLPLKNKGVKFMDVFVSEKAPAKKAFGT